MKPSLPFPASLALAIAVLSGTKQVVQQPVEPKEDSAGTAMSSDTTVQPIQPVQSEPAGLPEMAKVKDFSPVIKTKFLKN